MEHSRSSRKRTGGRLKPSRDRKKHEIGSEPTEPRVGEQKYKTVDARGDNQKVRALQTNVATVATDSGTVRADIEAVAENPANPNYARRNIITKGAVIDTSEGKAKVTSRPGQTGQVNAVLVE